MNRLDLKGVSKRAYSCHFESSELLFVYCTGFSGILYWSVCVSVCSSSFYVIVLRLIGYVSAITT